MTPLYLASRSPRRKELLEQAQIRFRIHVPREDELAAPKFRHQASARTIVKQISRGKGLACLRELKELGITESVVLAADTLVFLDHHVLGKPRDADHAKQMLRKLSGKWHEVYTGVTAFCMSGEKVREENIQVRTRVKFFTLKKDWIDWYVATGEPLDKAGAYGCQTHGSFLVEEFRGSYTNVVGLPLGQTLSLMEKVSGYPRGTWQKVNP